METITFDIETVPQTELSNIQQHELDKKLERRFSGSSEPTTEEYESAKSLIMGTNPYFGEIVCIGLMKTTTDGKYDTIGLTGDEKDILSHIIQTLNETYGTDLTEDDKVEVEKIVEKYTSNEEFKLVVQGNNTLENKRYKSNQVIDALLLDFVNTKLDLYKKLTDDIPNSILKQKLFEGVIASCSVNEVGVQ